MFTIYISTDNDIIPFFLYLFVLQFWRKKQLYELISCILETVAANSVSKSIG